LPIQELFFSFFTVLVPGGATVPVGTAFYMTKT
jgi:hypothetical protein